MNCPPGHAKGTYYNEYKSTAFYYRHYTARNETILSALVKEFYADYSLLAFY